MKVIMCFDVHISEKPPIENGLAQRSESDLVHVDLLLCSIIRIVNREGKNYTKKVCFCL